jgi:UDP:flavonoid glycosyltransferase YjiC (YdhE family)
VLAVSTVHDLRDLEAPDLMIEPFLPNHRVMPRADLVVAAAGQGTAQTAAAAGVPLIGVPLQPEQDLNIARLEELGMAKRIALRHAGGPRMTAAVGELLAGPRYREAARRVRGWVAGVDGAAGAADAIMAYLGNRRPPLATAA